jgi:hypothetical protein
VLQKSWGGFDFVFDPEEQFFGFIFCPFKPGTGGILRSSTAKLMLHWWEGKRCKERKGKPDSRRKFIIGARHEKNHIYQQSDRIKVSMAMCGGEPIAHPAMPDINMYIFLYPPATNSLRVMYNLMRRAPHLWPSPEGGGRNQELFSQVVIRCRVIIEIMF